MNQWLQHVWTSLRTNGNLISLHAATPATFESTLLKHNTEIQVEEAHQHQHRTTKSASVELAASASASCAAWSCTCQGLSDGFGLHHKHSWGTADSDARNWWMGHSCTTVPSSSETLAFPLEASLAASPKQNTDSIYHESTWKAMHRAPVKTYTIMGTTMTMKGLSTTWLDVVAQEFRKDDYGIAALSAEELGDAPIIVDIGANVGFFSIMMAKKFPNATIYALEPVEINFAFLNWNLGRNAITNVVPLNFGVGDKTGLVELQSIHSWNQGGSTMDNYKVHVQHVGPSR